MFLFLLFVILFCSVKCDIESTCNGNSTFCVDVSGSCGSSCQYSTIMEAINAVPSNTSGYKIILVGSSFATSVCTESLEIGMEKKSIDVSLPHEIFPYDGHVLEIQCSTSSCLVYDSMNWKIHGGSDEASISFKHSSVSSPPSNIVEIRNSPLELYDVSIIEASASSFSSDSGIEISLNHENATLSDSIILDKVIFETTSSSYYFDQAIYAEFHPNQENQTELSVYENAFLQIKNCNFMGVVESSVISVLRSSSILLENNYFNIGNKDISSVLNLDANGIRPSAVLFRNNIIDTPKGASYSVNDGVIVSMKYSRESESEGGSLLIYNNLFVGYGSRHDTFVVVSIEDNVQQLTHNTEFVNNLFKNVTTTSYGLSLMARSDDQALPCNVTYSYNTNWGPFTEGVWFVDEACRNSSTDGGNNEDGMISFYGSSDKPFPFYKLSEDLLGVSSSSYSSIFSSLIPSKDLMNRNRRSSAISRGPLETLCLDKLCGYITDLGLCVAEDVCLCADGERDNYHKGPECQCNLTLGGWNGSICYECSSALHEVVKEGGGCDCDSTNYFVREAGACVCKTNFRYDSTNDRCLCDGKNQEIKSGECVCEDGYKMSSSGSCDDKASSIISGTAIAGIVVGVLVFFVCIGICVVIIVVAIVIIAVEVFKQYNLAKLPSVNIPIDDAGDKKGSNVTLIDRT